MDQGVKSKAMVSIGFRKKLMKNVAKSQNLEKNQSNNYSKLWIKTEMEE